MSTSRAPAGPSEASQLVQQLLNERRELLVANERLRLELHEQRAKEAGPDPRLGRLERENAMLRQELATVRAELETFETGVRRAVAQLEAELEV